MIVVKLIGGLGNQMFQYATGRSLALRRNAEFKMDITGYAHQAGVDTPREYALRPFNVIEKFASEADIAKAKGVPKFLQRDGYFYKRLADIIEAKAGRNIVQRGNSFEPDVIDAGDGRYLSGYWQSEKYFTDAGDALRREFMLKDEAGTAHRPVSAEIKNSASVSLHVRRADYVTNPAAKAFHGTCSPEYYYGAAKIIIERVKNPHFFVFSDDIGWVKKNLNINQPVTYVSDSGLIDCEELTLMSRCSHHIIANSSFSWWGAWLNPRPNKIVIAPKKWLSDPKIDTSDLIPDGWIRI